MAKKKKKEGAQALLKGAGLKVTQARLAILRALMKEHGPFTIDELRGRVKGSKCDLVTLYRTLPTLEKGHLVRRCDFGDGTVRYEYQPAGHHHHHVICRLCRRITNLDDCLIEGIEKTLQSQGYTDITHSLEFFATCRKCS